MAKPELGTKRICPDTGRKFYDLNRDPIVSPYTGKSFPLSYFEDTNTGKVTENKEEDADTETDSEGNAPEMVSLDEADNENGGNENLPDIDDDSDDVELDDDDSDTFLEEDEDDDDDDMSNLIGGRPDDEDDA